MTDIPMIYDVGSDERRPVTQDDVDEMQKRLLWGARIREIVTSLLRPGAYNEFSADQVQQVYRILWPAGHGT